MCFTNTNITANSCFSAALPATDTDSKVDSLSWFNMNSLLQWSRHTETSIQFGTQSQFISFIFMHLLFKPRLSLLRSRTSQLCNPPATLVCQWADVVKHELTGSWFYHLKIMWCWLKAGWTELMLLDITVASTPNLLTRSCDFHSLILSGRLTRWQGDVGWLDSSDCAVKRVRVKQRRKTFVLSLWVLRDSTVWIMRPQVIPWGRCVCGWGEAVTSCH